jgi:hypothetical protein
MKTIKEKEKQFFDDISIYEDKTITEIFHFENDIEIYNYLNNPIFY